MKTRAVNVVRNIVEAYSLCFFGFAYSKAYIALNKPFIGGEAFSYSATFFLLSFSLMAVVLAFVSLAVNPKRLQGPLLKVSSVCLASAPILMAVNLYVLPGNTLLRIAVDIVSAVGCIGLSALWVDCYSVFNPTLVAFFVASSLVISRILDYVLVANVEPRIFVVLFILAVLAAVSYSKASAKAFPREYPRLACRPFFPVRVCLFVALCSFAQGMLNTDSTGTEAISAISRTLPACIVLLVIVFNAKRFSVRIPYGIAFSMMIMGLLIPPLIPDASSFWREFAMDVGYAALELMVPIMACTFAYNSGRSAIWAFCIFAALEMACRAFGGMVADMLVAFPLGAFYDGALLLLLVSAVLIIGIAMLSERNLFSRRVSSAKRSEKPDSADDLDALRTSANALSARYSLTQRETEVLHLLAQGKTNGMIARDMMIADGTVKAHVQHIYQKLGVHSREELRAMIDKG